MGDFCYHMPMDDELKLAVLVFQDSAIKSYLASRLLISSTYLAPIGLYNAHLALECLLKSLIAQKNSKPRFTHDLLLLLDDLKKLNDDEALTENRLQQEFERLNPYQELGRYGALAQPKNDPLRKDDGNIQVRGAISYQPSSDIIEIDYAVSTLLSLRSNDSPLLSELGTRQWNLPIPLEEVLLAQNDFIFLEENQT
jgi:HEPN domain-containing protein